MNIINRMDVLAEVYKLENTLDEFHRSGQSDNIILEYYNKICELLLPQEMFDQITEDNTFDLSEKVAYIERIRQRIFYDSGRIKPYIIPFKLYKYIGTPKFIIGISNSVKFNFADISNYIRKPINNLFSVTSSNFSSYQTYYVDNTSPFYVDITNVKWYKNIFEIGSLLEEKDVAKFIASLDVKDFYTRNMIIKGYNNDSLKGIFSCLEKFVQFQETIMFSIAKKLLRNDKKCFELIPNGMFGILNDYRVNDICNKWTIITFDDIPVYI